jgi:hypothetical protein
LIDNRLRTKVLEEKTQTFEEAIESFADLEYEKNAISTERYWTESSMSALKWVLGMTDEEPELDYLGPSGPLNPGESPKGEPTNMDLRKKKEFLATVTELVPNGETAVMEPPKPLGKIRKTRAKAEPKPKAERKPRPRTRAPYRVTFRATPEEARLLNDSFSKARITDWPTDRRESVRKLATRLEDFLTKYPETIDNLDGGAYSAEITLEKEKEERVEVEGEPSRAEG